MTRVHVIALIALTMAACGDDSAGGETPQASCGEGEVVEGRSMRVVTTIAPITSIVASVAGGTGTEIVGIVPETADSHTFEPKPNVATELADADVVFLNGLALDESTRDLARSNLAAGAEICELGTATLPEDQWLYSSSFPKRGGKPNPHLWTDPPLALEYARIVRDVLATRDPANADRYGDNYEAFAERLGDLHDAMRDATGTIEPERRLLLTDHDAFVYFAVEYGWTVVDERSADEAGVEYVAELHDDDLPGDPGDTEHSWLGMMRFDFVTMVEALGGDPAALRALDVRNVAPDTATYPQ